MQGSLIGDSLGMEIVEEEVFVLRFLIHIVECRKFETLWIGGLGNKFYLICRVLFQDIFQFLDIFVVSGDAADIESVASLEQSAVGEMLHLFPYHLFPVGVAEDMVDAVDGSRTGWSMAPGRQVLALVYSQCTLVYSL